MTVDSSGTLPTPADLRAELEDLIVRDLLGPIGGEEERIPGGIGGGILLGTFFGIIGGIKGTPGGLNPPPGTFD